MLFIYSMSRAVDVRSILPIKRAGDPSGYDHMNMLRCHWWRADLGLSVTHKHVALYTLHKGPLTKSLSLAPGEFAASVVFWQTKWLQLSNNALCEREQLVAPQQVFVTAGTLSFKQCKCMLCWIVIHWHRYKCFNQRAFGIFALLIMKMDQPTVPALLLNKLKRRHRVFAWKILATSFFHFLSTRLVSSL